MAGHRMIGQILLSAHSLNWEISRSFSQTYNAVQINVVGVENPKITISEPYKAGDFGTMFNINLNKKLTEKKANELYVKIPLNEIGAGKEIEIQGVLTNADGTTEGDNSFYKKIFIQGNKAINKKQEELLLFPTIANSQITLKNLNENATITILNIKGEIVYQNLSTNKNQTISVTDLANGNYFVKTDLRTKRFIVAK